jgi:hypothetical protein
MAVLSKQNGVPTDPIRGMLNDVVDMAGTPRPEDAIGTPADFVHLAGLPTFKEAVPTPMDITANLTKSLRANMPKFPRMPGGFPMPPIPGESRGDTDVGEAEAESRTGFRQRYYQKLPFPFPFP